MLKINDWLTLLTNVAVVVGIVFLVVEIQQNTDQLRSESRQALLANDQASLLIALDNIDIFEKMGPSEELSRTDQYRLGFVCAIDLRNREFEYVQYLNGLLDEETWRSFRNLILINHATPRGRLWWDKVGRQIADPTKPL